MTTPCLLSYISPRSLQPQVRSALQHLLAIACDGLARVNSTSKSKYIFLLALGLYNGASGSEDNLAEITYAYHLLSRAFYSTNSASASTTLLEKKIPTPDDSTRTPFCWFPIPFHSTCTGILLVGRWTMDEELERYLSFHSSFWEYSAVLAGFFKDPTHAWRGQYSLVTLDVSFT
jgi:hypothetical protein